ncbi:polyadenylate-binding protein 6-like [Olea europaea var. sylvestris]|uniref:polyadenylate-binding protein 6-like n=1 Tax=Olea europaea var. sylvestris TaxID=158386 RepID=UPI000C1CFE13|nr:polyadenylate-binding protein 6-like [Olea europaea var. sylvestris]
MTLTPSSGSPLLDPSQRASLYVSDLHLDVTEKDLLLVFSEVSWSDQENGYSVYCRFSRSLSCLVMWCFETIKTQGTFILWVTLLFLIQEIVIFWVCFPSAIHVVLRIKKYLIPLKWALFYVLLQENLNHEYRPYHEEDWHWEPLIKNIDPSITSARLQEVFVNYGEILSCKVAEENGKSKGFGFIQFDSEISAMAALNAVNGTLPEGKKLWSFEDHLKEKFSEYGKVCSAVTMKDENGKSKGFGFVNFDTHEEATKAMYFLYESGSKNLFVGRAQKKADRMKLLRQVHRHNYPESKAS